MRLPARFVVWMAVVNTHARTHRVNVSSPGTDRETERESPRASERASDKVMQLDGLRNYEHYPLTIKHTHVHERTHVLIKSSTIPVRYAY